jgi:phage-related protein
MKPLLWVASAKKDLLKMPEQVVDVFGYALYLAQNGLKHEQAKPLKGFGSAGVLEIVEDHDGNAYRGVYTVRFKKRSLCVTLFSEKIP